MNNLTEKKKTNYVFLSIDRWDEKRKRISSWMIIIFDECIVPDEKMPLLFLLKRERETKTHLIIFSNDQVRFLWSANLECQLNVRWCKEIFDKIDDDELNFDFGLLKFRRLDENDLTNFKEKSRMKKKDFLFWIVFLLI